MKGMNHVWLAGNIGGRIIFGRTRDDDLACSFSVASDHGGGTTWARVNAYGTVAAQCQGRAEKGVYVMVRGELMNRHGQFGELTEIRALDVVFLPAPTPSQGDIE